MYPNSTTIVIAQRDSSVREDLNPVTAYIIEKKDCLLADSNSEPTDERKNKHQAEIRLEIVRDNTDEMLIRILPQPFTT